METIIKNLSNLELIKDDQGQHWLKFKTDSGKICSISVENFFPGLVPKDMTVREWAKEQIEIHSRER